MTARPRPANGRKAFKGMAPDGFRIRMMEPGEAPALACLARRSRSGPVASVLRAQDDPHAFVRYLLAHEIFVAVEKTSGELAAFAAGRAETDLYWLSGLVVDEDARIAGLHSALLRAVEERARWFFFRAVGLSHPGDDTCAAGDFERHGYVLVPGDDLPAWLRGIARSEAVDGEEIARCVRVRWL